MNIFVLKILALCFMVLDHLNMYMPDIFPIEFRWIGRMAAPIFIFCLVQGMIHTSARKKYIIRLYAASVVLGIEEIILMNIFPNSQQPLMNSMFATLFIIGVFIYIINSGLSVKKKIIAFVGFILTQTIIGYIITILFIPINQLNTLSQSSLIEYTSKCECITNFLPNFIYCDGGFQWIILGVGMYLFRSNKKKLTIMYCLYSLFEFTSTALIGMTMSNLFFVNYQWIMIITVPFLLLYNGEKGKGLKFLFYIFYPLHIGVIFILSNII
ncbi:hypothetical protein CDLVIII_5303 [Clostridium sp. DL-VIII]|uniref:TraX family protein n=1 Tax=Clostridium sp. DL-VIII TaxID=641107 RepID=UPI00023B02EB|nr:TraX family protein [Clostridium sp. DL-VIII]EHJ01785.1 hypothetical protein CDLVIII_5303 [Clostridium sp. DL-VIII]